MHISLVYLLIEFFVVGVVLYRGFGRSGGKRISGWFYKRSSGWFSGRSFLGPKIYGVGLGGLGDRGLGRRRDYLCSVGED